MAVATNMIILVILFLILLFGGGALQVFLSLRRNKLLGLILPAVIFLLSMGILVDVMGAGRAGMSLAAVLVLIWNVPTIIDLIIYFACRAWMKRKEKSELDRMSAQDLE